MRERINTASSPTGVFNSHSCSPMLRSGVPGSMSKVKYATLTSWTLQTTRLVTMTLSISMAKRSAECFHYFTSIAISGRPIYRTFEFSYLYLYSTIRRNYQNKFFIDELLIVLIKKISKILYFDNSIKNPEKPSGHWSFPDYLY